MQNNCVIILTEKFMLRETTKHLRFACGFHFALNTFGMFQERIERFFVEAFE